jgi:hypothetical protein
MTISTIGPTGDTFYIPHPQPIWEFAITNLGARDVEWRAGIEVRGNSDTNYSHAGGFFDWPEGILAPGQGLHTNMVVPAKSGSVWRANIDYWPIRSKVHPDREIHTYKDVWH